MVFSASLDTSHDGQPNPFKDAGVLADSLTGMYNAMVECLCVEAMGSLLLHLSFPRDRCY
jgi:hypothetical protein